MADSKISALTDHAANPADTDLFVIVDVSDTTMAATGTNKKLAASYLATRTGTETFTNKTLTAPVIATIVNSGTLTLPTSTDTLVGRATTDTLTNKTLTTPTIASFVNATHTHADAAGGGTIAHSVLTGLTSGNPHTQYLLADGTTTGATSSRQVFTNGISAPTLRPISDSTTAYQIQTTAGTTILTVDTTNRRMEIAAGSTTYGLKINGNLLMSGGTADIGIPSGELMQLGAWDGTFTTFTVGATFSANGFVVGANSTPNGAGKFESQSDSSTAWTALSGNDFFTAVAGDAVAVRNVNASADFSGIFLSNRTSSVSAARIAVQHAGAAAGDLVFALRNSASFPEVMRLRANGQIAIGAHTTTPTALFDVAGATTSRASHRIRSGTAPTAPNAGDVWNDGALTFYEANSTTNAVVNTLVLRRASTGTPGAGFGAGFRVGLASDTTTNQDAGRLTFAWNAATHASRAVIGKLTAYYTSTERDMITWTAASTAASSLVSLTGRVGINETAPEYSLHITGDNSSMFPLIKLKNTQGGGKSYWLYSGAAEAGGFGLYNETDTRYAIFVDADGNTGIGNITDPRSILHAHDGSGGCIFINRSGVGGTLVTVIPDGTGDVTANISFFGWVSNSVPFTAQVTDQYLTVSSSTTFTDGTNTLTVAVTAGGAFTLQRTAGTATWNVCLWAFWR
jgi:hypothetical protein